MIPIAIIEAVAASRCAIHGAHAADRTIAPKLSHRRLRHAKLLGRGSKRATPPRLDVAVSQPAGRIRASETERDTESRQEAA